MIQFLSENKVIAYHLHDEKRSYDHHKAVVSPEGKLVSTSPEFKGEVNKDGSHVKLFCLMKTTAEAIRSEVSKDGRFYCAVSNPDHYGGEYHYLVQVSKYPIVHLSFDS